MFIRKYYDIADVDTGGDIAIEEAAVETLSPAQAMAKHGSKSDESGKLPDPIEIKGTKEEPKTEVVPEAATAKEEPKVEAKADEPKTEPVVEAKVEEKAPIVQDTQKQQSLEEVLKTNQPEAIFKALGFDDEKVALVSEMKDLDPKVVGIIQAYKNGTLGEYAQALSTDYTKMSDEDVMRHQLRKEYPKVSDAAFEALFEDEVLDKYKLDSDVYSEAETAKGKLLLEAKAAKYRDELVANQEKYLMPAKPEPKVETKQVDNTAEIQRQQIETYRRELSETPYTKDIIANKSITVGEGAEAFKYPVDANSLIDILSDGAKWVETMYDKEVGADGKEVFIPRTQHQLLTAAFAQDSTKFLNEYAKHLKSIGAKEVIEPIENASPADKSKPAKSDSLPTSAAEAMAKSGTRSNGGG